MFSAEYQHLHWLPSLLRQVLKDGKLPTAATHAHLPPSVSFEHFDKVPDLHGANLFLCRRREWKLFYNIYLRLYTIERDNRRAGLADNKNTLPETEILFSLRVAWQDDADMLWFIRRHPATYGPGPAFRLRS
ncbi:MAG: hypothetical protein P4L43_19275 [Syntrophobacteraceae bacterium]|nr:hypothetical protein [Syntrophobacteraceae bacterium]